MRGALVGVSMSNKLIEIAHNGDLKLYRRIARNGSSGWAWVGGPAYVIYKGLALYREFDWESEAQAFLAAARCPDCDNTLNSCVCGLQSQCP